MKEEIKERLRRPAAHWAFIAMFAICLLCGVGMLYVTVRFGSFGYMVMTAAAFVAAAHFWM
jgi:hypothetical protein